MGGAWERLVCSIKTALYATLKERTPKDKVLRNLLVEAENIVNSRPLTYKPRSRYNGIYNSKPFFTTKRTSLVFTRNFQ
jgi:hypothetical protein